MRGKKGKYSVGTSVFAKATPDEHLIVLRFDINTYYCKLADESDPTELLYFEVELMSSEEKKAIS